MLTDRPYHMGYVDCLKGCCCTNSGDPDQFLDALKDLCDVYGYKLSGWAHPVPAPELARAYFIDKNYELHAIGEVN